MAGRPLTIRIVADRLPGRTFGAYHDVRVGLQVGKQVTATVAGDAPSAVWEASATVVAAGDGAPSVRGPAIHGPRGERFLYLSWISATPAGDAMFRRAKVQLDAVPRALLDEAVASGRPLVARLALTDEKGGPRCASVRPPLVAWSLA